MFEWVGVGKVQGRGEGEMAGKSQMVGFSLQVAENDSYTFWDDWL